MLPCDSPHLAIYRTHKRALVTTCPRLGITVFFFDVAWGFPVACNTVHVNRSKIDPSLAEKVDLAEEQEPYYNVITQAIRVLVSGLETRVEPAFRAMSATNWGSCEMVGEESHYVRSIHDAFQSFIPNIRSLLSTVYFR